MKIYQNILLAIWSLMYLLAVYQFITGKLELITLIALSIGFAGYIGLFITNLIKRNIK